METTVGESEGTMASNDQRGPVDARREAAAWSLLRNPVTWTLTALVVSIIGLYIDMR